MLIEEKLRELFALSLQIKGANFDHHPSAENIHIYRFVKGAVPPRYDIDIHANYGDWCPDNHEKSLTNAIKKAKETIKQQNS